MAVFLGAFPLLPGKEDEARKFAEETLSRGGWAEAQADGGITREEWALQESEMGSMVLVRFEAPDIEASFARLAVSTDEFDVWFRGRVMDLTGIDLSSPADGAPPEVILDWSA
jgi:hypothetical protein